MSKTTSAPVNPADLPTATKVFAFSLLCLGFYASVFTLFGLIMLEQMPEWAPCFLGLAACYALLKLSFGV